MITIESILSEPTRSTFSISGSDGDITASTAPQMMFADPPVSALNMSSISGNDGNIAASHAPQMMFAHPPVSAISTSSISGNHCDSFIPIKKRRVSEILQSVVKWPEKSKSVKQTRRKEVTPCSVTSKTWIEINEAKQAEKERTEKEKELRKKERDEKKRIINEEKAQKKIMMEKKKAEKINKQEKVEKKKKIKKEN